MLFFTIVGEGIFVRQFFVKKSFGHEGSHGQYLERPVVDSVRFRVLQVGECNGNRVSNLKMDNLHVFE